MFCVNCGKPLNNDFKVCPYCGTSISNVAMPISSNGFDIRDGVLVKYFGRAKYVIIPVGVKIIGKYAFCEEKNIGNAYIEKINIPNSVIKIEEYAFYGCANLTNIILPDSILTIGENAFSNCTNLSRVVLPERLTIIKQGTFRNCERLHSVYIPQTVTKIESDAFIVSSGSDYTAPTSCPLLKTKIPDSVLEIEKSVHVYYSAYNDDIRYREIFYAGIELHRIDENILNKKHVELIRKENNRCMFCGGTFSLFGKCKICGQRKNY